MMEVDLKSHEEIKNDRLEMFNFRDKNCQSSVRAEHKKKTNSQKKIF